MNVLRTATALTLGLIIVLPACSDRAPEPQRAKVSSLTSDRNDDNGDDDGRDDGSDPDADERSGDPGASSTDDDAPSGNVAPGDADEAQGWGDCARAVAVCGSCIRWRWYRAIPYPYGWDAKCIQQRGAACIDAAVACGITISEHL